VKGFSDLGFTNSATPIHYNGEIKHAEIMIGNSVVMLADAIEGWPAVPSWLHIYVDDVDATYRKGAGSGRPLGSGAAGKRGRPRSARRSERSGWQYLVDFDAESLNLWTAATERSVARRAAASREGGTPLWALAIHLQRASNQTALSRICGSVLGVRCSRHSEIAN
jgi:hypothetical protein